MSESSKNAVNVSIEVAPTTYIKLEKLAEERKMTLEELLAFLTRCKYTNLACEV